MREYRKGGVRFEAFTEPALKGEITFILSLFNSSPSWQTSPDRHQNISPPRFSRKPSHGTFYGGFSCLFELNRGDISIFVKLGEKVYFFQLTTIDLLLEFHTTLFSQNHYFLWTKIGQRGHLDQSPTYPFSRICYQCFLSPRLQPNFNGFGPPFGKNSNK